MNSQEIAFDCLHGSAKSLIAAEYFNRIATEGTLPLRANRVVFGISVACLVRG